MQAIDALRNLMQYREILELEEVSKASARRFRVHF